MADGLGATLETSERRKGQLKKPCGPSIMEMEDDNHSIRHIPEASKQGVPSQKLLFVSTTRKGEAVNQCPEQRQEGRVENSATGEGLQRTPFLEESESVSDNLQIASTHRHTTVARAVLHPFCSSVTRWSPPNNSNPSLQRPSALGKTLLCSEDDDIQITYESTLDDHRDDIPCDCDEFRCTSDADYFGLNDEDDGPQSTLFLMPEDAIYSAGDASDAISEPESGDFEKPLHELPSDASAKKSPFECVLRSQPCDKGDVKFANTKDSSSNVIVRSRLKNRESVDPPEERNVSPLLSGDEDDESPLPSEMKIHIIEDDCGIDLEWAKKSGSEGNTDMSKSHTGSSCSEIQSKSLDSDDDQKLNHSSCSSASESTSVNSNEQKPSITGQSGALVMSDTASAQSVEISRGLMQNHASPQKQREGELRNYLPFMNAPVLFSSISIGGSESGYSTYSNDTVIECASESYERERLPSPSYTVTPAPRESESEMTSLNQEKANAHGKSSFLTMWSSSSSPSMRREAIASDFVLLSPVDDSEPGVDSFDIYSGMSLALKPETKNGILSDDQDPTEQNDRSKDGSGSLCKDREGYTSASRTDNTQCRQQSVILQASHEGSDGTEFIGQELSLQREKRQSEARNDFALQFEGSIDACSHINTFSSSIEHVSAGDQLIKDGDSKESSTRDEDLPSFASKRQRPDNFCEQSSCKKQNLTISPCGTLHQQINSAADPRKIDHCDVSVYTSRGSKQTEPIKLQYDGKSRLLSKEARRAIAQPGGDEITTTFSDVNGTYYDVSTQPLDDTNSGEIRTTRPTPRRQEQYKATQDILLTREPEKHPISLTLSDVNGTSCEISWQSCDESLQGEDQMPSTDDETNREETQRCIRRKIYKIQTTSPLSNGNSQFPNKLVVPANDPGMDYNTNNDHQVEVFIANNRIRIGMADTPERHPDTVFSNPTTFFDPMSVADSNAESSTPESDFQRTSDVNDVALSKPYPLTKYAQQPASSAEDDFVSSLVRKVKSYDAEMIAARTKRQLDRTAQTYERFTSVPLSETKDGIPKSYTMSSIIRKLSPTNRSLFTMMSGSFSASVSSIGTSASSTTSLPPPTEENLHPRSSEQVKSEKEEEECSSSETEHDSHADGKVLYEADTSRSINLASSSETLACHLVEGVNTTYIHYVEGSPSRTNNLAAQDVHRPSASFEAAMFGEPSRDRDEPTRSVKSKNLIPASQPYQNNAPIQTRTPGDKRQAEMDKSHLNSYIVSTTKVQTPSDANGGLGQDPDDSKRQKESIRHIPGSPARNPSPGLSIVSNNHCSPVAQILSLSEDEKDGLDDSCPVATTFDRAKKLKPSQTISSPFPEREGSGSESSSSHGSNRDVDTDIIASDSILSSQAGEHMEASGSPSRSLSNISKSSMESFIDIISVHQEPETIVATEDERERASEVRNGVEYIGSPIYINKLSSAIWRIFNKLRFAPHSVSQRSPLTEPLLPLTADERSHDEDPNSDGHASVEAMVVSQASVDHTNNDNNIDLAEQGGGEPSRQVTQHREGHFCQRALRMCCCRLPHLLWSLLGVLIFLGLTIIVSAKTMPVL